MKLSRRFAPTSQKLQCQADFQNAQRRFVVPLDVEHEKLEDIVSCIEHGKISVDATSYGRLLRACGNEKDLSLGLRVHANIVRLGMDQNMFVGTHTINMYGRCGMIEDARRVFDKLPLKNVVSWTAIITAYAHKGYSDEALLLFQNMQLEGEMPNCVTFCSILSILDSPSYLYEGMKIHSQAIESGYGFGLMVGNAIINMYGKCKSLKLALQMFDQMLQVNVVTWNGLIATYVVHGRLKQAIRAYMQLQLDGMKATAITFMTVLNAMTDAAEGRMIHAHVVEAGFESNVTVTNALLNMYGKFSSVEEARCLFDKMKIRGVISWSTMIASYSQRDDWRNASILFRQMLQEGMEPNDITFINFIESCSELSDAEFIYTCIIEKTLLETVAVGSAVINMFSKCGNIEKASDAFNRMRERNVISWTAIIGAYAQHERCKLSLQLFWQMQFEGVLPDIVTILTVIDTSMMIGSLAQAKKIHALAIERKFDSNIVVRNALMNMYAKCGNVELALKIFDGAAESNLFAWNGIVTACAQHGFLQETLELFLQMQHEGIDSDGVTFIAILTACSHAGLLDRCHDYFLSMADDFNVVRGSEHFGCVIDLLCRSGRLGEAESIILDMPVFADTVAWIALLSACKVHGDSARGKRAAKRVLDLNPQNSSSYSLLSGIQ